MSAVVYTAIFGGFDELQQPVPQNEDCEFICFTDAKMPARVGLWRVIRVRPQPDMSPRMQAKRFKLLSHRIFPRGRLAMRYAPFSRRRRLDLSIWIDASRRIKSPAFVADMRVNLGDGEWAMFIHPWRDCIYQEAIASMELPKYQGMPILAQVDAYRPVVPPHSGLYGCTVIVRREPAARRIIRANELWWDENVKWTAQDQLSLPYVLRKIANCEPRLIREDKFHNAWFDFVPHPTGNLV